MERLEILKLLKKHRDVIESKQGYVLGIPASDFETLAKDIEKIATKKRSKNSELELA